jgi:hypothetical protein
VGALVEDARRLLDAKSYEECRIYAEKALEIDEESRAAAHLLDEVLLKTSRLHWEVTEKVPGEIEVSLHCRSKAQVRLVNITKGREPQPTMEWSSEDSGPVLVQEIVKLERLDFRYSAEVYLETSAGGVVAYASCELNQKGEIVAVSPSDLRDGRSDLTRFKKAGLS